MPAIEITNMFFHVVLYVKLCSYDLLYEVTSSTIIKKLFS